MASFARSFKPPTALLSPRRRPAMPCRTLSNSSELSLTSNAFAADYFNDKPFTSAPHTPSLSPIVGPAQGEGSASTGERSIGSPTSAFPSPRTSHSNPITIEVPKSKKLGPDSTRIPTEPLSARGDLPGGYFPLHEDPKCRVRRPHPFFHDPSISRHQRNSDSTTMQTERIRTAHTTMSSPKVQSSTPVSSYIAPGFHDAPLPVGKYYPSNYEQQYSQNGQPDVRSASVTGSSSSLARSGSHSEQLRPGSTPSETPQMEMRRKMQQYKRDMIAQATMVLGTSHKSSTSIALNGMPLKDQLLSAPGQKPLSPRLHPLGSPGPVTPMELESSCSSYLDTGLKPPSPLSKDGLSPGPAHTGRSV